MSNTELRDAMLAAAAGWERAPWDGNINTPHTLQDEYELARRLGVDTLTTDEDGQMVAYAE